MKLTMVVVIYKQLIEESKTFQTLDATLLSKASSLDNIDLILYDNSPEKQEFNHLHFEGVRIFYVHDSRNLGITTAYNYARKKARENESEWLLLLDHDTELTNAYFNKILNLPEIETRIAAVVPRINCKNTMISPVYSNTLRPLLEKQPMTGLQEKPVMAINSGALIRIDFLNEIGGFNEDFPLDYLDHWLFHEIYAKDRKVWLMDVTLDHDLSVMDYSRVSLERYQSILDSEIRFYKNYKRDLLSAYRTQLGKRFLKQLLLVKNKKIAIYTLRRLFSM